MFTSPGSSGPVADRANPRAAYVLRVLRDSRRGKPNISLRFVRGLGRGIPAKPATKAPKTAPIAQSGCSSIAPLKVSFLVSPITYDGFRAFRQHSAASHPVTIVDLLERVLKAFCDGILMGYSQTLVRPNKMKVKRLPARGLPNNFGLRECNRTFGQTLP
jgi:hypothetical protein